MTPSGFDPWARSTIASDYAAWTSSVDHILATPGYEGSPWPRPMTLEENLGI